MKYNNNNSSSSFKSWISRNSFEICWLGFWAILIGSFISLAAHESSIEHNRTYTMVVDIYYNDTPERHTYISDGVPITYLSCKGTNKVAGEKIYVLTTAPIKVISNTYKEKDKK